MTKDGDSLAIDRKTGQRMVLLAYEILFLFFGNGIYKIENFKVMI